MNNLDASVIIRVKNEEVNMKRCLEGVFGQKTNKRFEVLVVDSGSTDSTLSIASQFKCRILEIPPKEFTYAHALNEGVKYSAGEYCVFISADAYPGNESWMDSILAPFSDPSISAVYGRQIPVLGLNPIEEAELLKLYPVSRQHEVASAANCAAKRYLLAQYPFKDAVGKLSVGNKPSLEDALWKSTIESKGYRTLYEPDAVVVHSHIYTKYLRKTYWQEFFHGYFTVYFSSLVSPRGVDKFPLLGKIPKTLRYIINSLMYLAKNRYYQFIPAYFFTLFVATFRFVYGYYKGLADIKNNAK